MPYCISLNWKLDLNCNEIMSTFCIFRAQWDTTEFSTLIPKTLVSSNVRSSDCTLKAAAAEKKKRHPGSEILTDILSNRQRRRRLLQQRLVPPTARFPPRPSWAPPSFCFTFIFKFEYCSVAGDSQVVFLLIAFHAGVVVSSCISLLRRQLSFISHMSGSSFARGGGGGVGML